MTLSTTTSITTIRLNTLILFGAGVSCGLHLHSFSDTDDVSFSQGDDDMDADEKKDVKILHPKFGE